MSWTDYFLIPFNVSLQRMKNTLLVKDNNILDDNAKYNSSKRLRGDLLSSIEVALYVYDTSQLYCMIFGDDYHININNEAQLVSCLDSLIQFKEDDKIYIDIVDKMIIDELIFRIEGRIEEIISSEDYNPEA